MKTGKRILSVLLAVLMLAATLTVAFAAGEKKDPVYVIFKLPAFKSWDLDTLDVYYRDNYSAEIYSITKFNDFYSDDQTGLLVRYDEDNYQAFFKKNSDIVAAHQDFEQKQKDFKEVKLWHFASGKIDDSFFYVLADYNSPFIVSVEDYNGSCYHEFEIKGLQSSSCGTETAGNYFCQNCSRSFSFKFPAEHVYGEDIFRKASTCTEGYVVSRYCARCNNVETENGKPLGHNYEKVGTTVPATCFTDGYIKRVCLNPNCGKISITTEGQPKATGKHTDSNKDNHCDVCGTIINKPKETETSEEKAPKKNFFQRIIDWFRDLFKKLFK